MLIRAVHTAFSRWLATLLLAGLAATAPGPSASVSTT